MSAENKELAIRALDQMRGDDLYRAKAAFRNCTYKEMQEEYGSSGRTRAQILAEYEAREAEINKAIAWIKSL